MTIKLPLKRSFASLCDFLATLRDSLTIAAEGATNNETAIDALRTAIIAGTVSIEESEET